MSTSQNRKPEDDAKPYSFPGARRGVIPLIKKVNNELQRMKEEKIIEEKYGPVKVISPIDFVLKPSGQVS